ncbi:MAG: hypothetical protein KA144_10590 [Xanthomonadaceae bacterium]|nr:hypothetical protein [Xanthomonadaceae bacterium]
MRIAPRPNFASRFASQAASTHAFKMPTPFATALVAMLATLIAACGAASPPAAAAKQAPPPATEAPSGKPAGKISPDMVGKLSPIATFIGRGDGWRIEIRALDTRQHHVALHWAKPARTDTGTARYFGALDIPPGSTLVLNGHLRTPTDSTQTLDIEIRSQDCIDDQGTPRPQTIVLTLADGRRLEGCGDLARY